MTTDHLPSRKPLDNHRALFEHVFEQAAVQTLEGWVLDQLDNDPDVSWRELERRIVDETQGLLAVSHVTLSGWFRDLRAEYTSRNARRPAA